MGNQKETIARTMVRAREIKIIVVRFIYPSLDFNQDHVIGSHLY